MNNDNMEKLYIDWYIDDKNNGFRRYSKFIINRWTAVINRNVLTINIRSLLL